MSNELARIAEVVSKHPNEKLQTLVHAINTSSLKAKHLKLDGKKATGVDGTSKAEYEKQLDQRLEQLVESMKKQAYKPQSVRRVHIPKGTKGENQAAWHTFV